MKKELIKIVILGILKNKELSSLQILNIMHKIVSISEASFFSVVNELINENLIASYDNNRFSNKTLYRITTLGKLRLEKFKDEYEMVLAVNEFLRSEC